MQIVIDIDDKLYKRLFVNGVDNYDDAVDMANAIRKGTPLPKGHGDLIDANELNRIMYHKAFETDSDMQKWDSGCWIRYKMFENSMKEMPTIIEAEGAKR